MDFVRVSSLTDVRIRSQEQEAEVKELRQSLSQLQHDDSSPNKSLHLEYIKESLDTSFRLELNQLKAEITRQATVKQTQSKKLSDHEKVVILQRELGKLRTLHSTDQATIGSLTEDVAVLRNRLAKQKALILSSSSQRIRKSDIQAALAKAQAKAFVTMSPFKRQQFMNSDPTGHLYGIPQGAFDDFTVQGFGSDRATMASTAFSGGSSDCDYSS
ncbi:uncharacterized protein [Amphiura filiformis]|uniref:uncharacterized protein n=1 Tax=Amphiura filiformis TaxID=82378 RepID=UPI003B221D8F